MSDIINNNISKASSKEEIAEFLSSNYKISQEVKNNFIKEDISGEILLDLGINELKNLGLKIGPIKKFQDYLKKNKDKFDSKPNNLKINMNSDEKDVKIFMENYLNFKGSLNKINGKKLFDLSLEEMKDEGLNLGQRKKLYKYIQYAKENIAKKKITKKSDKAEVGKYLKEILNFSDKAIREMELDGESLFLLSEEDIDELEELNEEEKDKLKNFLKSQKEKDVNI